VIRFRTLRRQLFPAVWSTFATLAAISVLSACGHRGEVSHGYSEGQDPEGNDTESYSSNLEFGSAVDMRFRDLDAHLRAGRYDEAIRTAQTLYRDHGLSRERRAKALLRWAEAEGNALNPSRDVDDAIARLELLLDEYPKTEVADEARSTLDRFRKYREDNPR
jgi:hypothetical protein